MVFFPLSCISENLFYLFGQVVIRSLIWMFTALMDVLFDFYDSQRK